MIQAKQQKFGFTLLELLLVIAILGILSSLGITYYMQQENVAKVDRTVLQIQQFLQAANTYYLKTNNSWPNASPDPNFEPYIPLGMTTNPWGGNYSYAPIAGGKLFSVTVTNIPSSSANQIVNKLPSATTMNCTAKLCVVQAQESIPFQPGQVGNFLVKFINETNLMSNQQTWNPPPFTCPIGWRGHIETMLNGMWANPPSSFQKWCLVGMTSVLISELNADTACGQTGKNVSCSFQLNAYTRPSEGQPGKPEACSNYVSPIDYGTVKLAYIEYCCIPDPSNPANCAPPS